MTEMRLTSNQSLNKAPATEFNSSNELHNQWHSELHSTRSEKPTRQDLYPFVSHSNLIHSGYL